MLDFHDLGRYRENNRIEAKKAQGGLPRSIWETYSSFANTVGGVLLLGVIEAADTKKLQPVRLPDPQKLCEEFWTLINDPKVASVNILRRQDVQIISADGVPIVAIEVPPASRREKPVYVGADPIHGTYKRSGEGDYHCTPEEVRAMLRERGSASPDSALLTGLPPAAFHWSAVARFRRQMQALRPGHASQQMDHLQFLCSIGAAGYDAHRRAHPTAAGLLMFGRLAHIRSVFPHYHLEYREPAPSGHAVRRISTGSTLGCGCLYEFYGQVSARLAAAPIPGGAPVQSALRQALANALIHADYTAARGLLVLRQPGAVRILNPGCMRVSAEDAFSGVSDLRNENLMEFFRLIDAARHTGSGLPGIRRLWQAQGWQPPVLGEQLSPDCTLLTLYLPPLGSLPAAAGRRMRLGRQDLLDYLRDQVDASPRQLARALGLPRRQVDRLLDQLCREELIVPVGSGLFTRWRLRD